MQTQLKNTCMKNRLQPVCLRFSTDEFERLCYLRVTCHFNYKEPIHMKSDLRVSFESAQVQCILDLLRSLKFSIKTAQLPGQVSRVKYWIWNLAHLQSIKNRYNTCQNFQSTEIEHIHLIRETLLFD